MINWEQDMIDMHNLMNENLSDDTNDVLLLIILS